MSEKQFVNGYLKWTKKKGYHQRPVDIYFIFWLYNDVTVIFVI